MTEKLPDPQEVLRQDVEDTALVRRLEEHAAKLTESVDSTLRLTDLRKEQIIGYFKEGAAKGSREAKLIVAAMGALGEI